jgi:DNA primase large subunit
MMVLVNPFSDEVRAYLSIDLNNIEGELIRMAIARAKVENLDNYLEADERADAISLFLLFQSFAQTPHAPEVTAFLGAYEALIRERLVRFYSDDLLAHMETLIPIIPLRSIGTGEIPRTSEVTIPEIGQQVPREDLYRLRTQRKADISFALRWEDVYDVTDITNEYVVGSYVLLTKWELIDLYAKTLRSKCFSYIKSLAPKMEGVTHPVYEKISSMVKTLVKVANPIENVSGALETEAFPPCIAIALSGVPAGQRNYGITILLTSFLSYARLLPSTKIFDRDASFTLSQDDIQVLLAEVVPEIISAGDRCDPPFFKEQPLERLNIFYHMGFGMTDNPTPSDYGKSKWYLPPSCAKVAENAPQLCQPDAFCKRVKWVVADREQAKEIVEKARDRNRGALGESILEKLLKTPQTAQSLKEQTGADEKELMQLLSTLSKNKLIMRRKVTNPLIYYIRKKRELNQKS